ncbi:MAG: SDR family NAD(P)-dependent oxidoreductase [Pseudomonadota bacterium]
MNQKIALVTGASSGLGAVMTQQLADDGYYVFAAARRQDRLEAMRSERIEPLILDVTQDDAIHSAIAHILSSKNRIDLLVNNAGYGYYATIEEGDITAVKQLFEVNYFGIMRMTQAVLPHMRAQGCGMIVNMASVVGQVAFPVIGYYAATKHAVEAFSDALRMEVNQFGIKVVIIEPSMIKTEFGSIAIEHLKQSQRLDSYHKLTNKFKRLMTTRQGKSASPKRLAGVMHNIITAKRPKRRYVVGTDAHFVIFIKNKIGYCLIDPIARRITGANK